MVVLDLQFDRTCVKLSLYFSNISTALRWAFARTFDDHAGMPGPRLKDELYA